MLSSTGERFESIILYPATKRRVTVRVPGQFYALCIFDYTKPQH